MQIWNLHYYPWMQTISIMSTIKCLKSEYILIKKNVQFNYKINTLFYDM